MLPLAFGQAKACQLQSANRRPGQRGAVIAGCSQHAFDLMIFALIEHDLDAAIVEFAARQRSERGRLVMQFHPGQQIRDQLLGYRLGGGGDIGLGLVALGG